MPEEHTEHTDEQIAYRVQKGNTESFGVLVERYEPKLLRYGRKFLANGEDIQDMVQNAFISAYQNIQSFDIKQRFSPWIYRIAHNIFVNGLRRNKRSPIITIDFDTFVAHPVYDDPVEKEREQGEMKVMIDKGLEQLPQKYREILILYYLEEMAYKDIADILQVPTGTVGVRLARAKKSLKDAYTKLNISYEL